MQLSLQTFQQLLQRMSAAVQNSASQLIDLSAGSMLRAILEANASIGLWIQWLIVQTLRMTRASTSVGEDLDTWMADFLLERQPAAAARGTATFSRLLTGTTLLIPGGITVKASTDNVTFTALSDIGHAAWQANLNGYIVQIGVSTIDLPVVAQSPGAHGNVAAGSISVLASVVPGLDFVSNTYALSGGCDAESDSQFRSRFRDYINSRSQATATAIDYAVRSLQQNLRYKVVENCDATASWMPGHFLVIAGDGAGHLSPTLRSNIYQVIDGVRPIGSNFAVRAADVVSVNVVIALVAGGSAVDPATASAVKSAVSDYIDLLGIGCTLSTTRVVEAAYRSGHLLGNISGVSINGSAADLTGSEYGIFRTQSVMVQ
jgi:hypothetical protein